MTTIDPRTGYAPVNGLEMYYEIHGEGAPLLLLHGAYMTIDLMDAILPGLAAFTAGDRRRAAGPWPHRRHRPPDHVRADGRRFGGTAGSPRGRARPMSWATAWVARSRLQMAIRHPAVVRKVVVASASYTSDGMHAVAWRCSRRSHPRCSPDRRSRRPTSAPPRIPGTFPVLVDKLRRLDTTPFAWSADDIRAIVAPILIVLGDSDVVRLEHAVELFGLLGGGVMGDLGAMPRSQLAVLPATTHFMPPGSGLLDQHRGCCR